MDRRENIKVLLAGTVATGFLISSGCAPDDIKKSESIIAAGLYGRTPKEIEVDSKLMADTFFSDHEKKIVSLISEIIIPKDDVSIGATEAGVTDFIEFMVKDYPKFQLPIRGGLMWLENLSWATFDNH